MATAQRQVHQLRVGAPSEVLARAMLPRLEDALRCASLPDAGAQLLLVRRLHLGRVDAAATAQALALAIESRFRSAPGGWLQGETAGDATQAMQVVFAGALEARVALVARLLRAEPCSAWYWQRAVPEWQPAAAPAQALVAVLRELASWPQARVALPAFCAGVAARAGCGPLALAVPQALGEACCAAAGLTPGQATARHRQADLQPADGELPRWLLRLLQAAIGPAWPADALAARPGRLDAKPSPDAPEPGTSDLERAAVHAADPGAAAKGPVPQPQSPGPVRSARPPQAQGPHAALAAAAAPAEPHTDPLPPQPHAPGARLPTGLAPGLAQTPARQLRSSLGPASGPIAVEPGIAGLPTPHAGLLFLLPVLQRLGLPGWAAVAGIDPRPCACAVLAAALQRMRAEPTDPVWMLCNDSAAAEQGRAPAPDSWHGSASAAPRGRPALPLAAALAQAADPAAQAACWLQAARRWLRRGPHVGLATLVRRPGRVMATATCVDLVFRLGDADLRLRRHGLDIDPGWLPWFGRVVAFHYRPDTP